MILPDEEVVNLVGRREAGDDVLLDTHDVLVNPYRVLEESCRVATGALKGLLELVLDRFNDAFLDFGTIMLDDTSVRLQ